MSDIGSLHDSELIISVNRGKGSIGCKYGGMEVVVDCLDGANGTCLLMKLGVFSKNIVSIETICGVWPTSQLDYILIFHFTIKGISFIIYM